MMESLVLKSNLSITPSSNNSTNINDNKHQSHHSWRNYNGTILVLPSSGGVSWSSKALKSTSNTRVSVVVRAEHGIGGALMEAAKGLVLTPNGTTNKKNNDGKNIAVNDNNLAVPYDGSLSQSLSSSSSSSTSMHEERRDDNDNDNDGIGILKFLKGKRFFITGATGFLAKVLIEKMLRTEPNVGKIFVLIRAKDEEAAAQRLKNDIINSELFKSLREIHGKDYEGFMVRKLIPVVGNACVSDLGLQPHLAHIIANEVDVIVNSAANTKFDERYDVAIDINIKGASNLMVFAKKCSNLKLFLQISTAYVNGQRQGRIMEKPFRIGESIAMENNSSSSSPSSSSSSSSPSSLLTLDVESEIKLAFNTIQACQHNNNNLVVQKIMKELGLQRAKRFGWQDTYVFTKAMGEMVIDKMRGEIPVAIIRPSVIESTFKDPFPGWVEGNRMMDPLLLYYGKGQLSGFLMDPNGVIDVVPADMVVNATLAAIARHGSNPKAGMNIYQIASSVANPLAFGHLVRLLHQHFNTSPCFDSKGRPIHVPSMKVFDSIHDFSAHLWRSSPQSSSSSTTTATTSSSSSDAATSSTTTTSNVSRKTIRRVQYLAHIYEPYVFYKGRFDNGNAKKLMEIMSEEEKREFGFDVESIDWTDYITNIHIPGLKRHVMKGNNSKSL